jgi:glycosyltransferase involved in cell wall biosynthesis
VKICLVSQEYPPETGHGGHATQTATRARGLVELGHSVTVITTSLEPTRRLTQDGAVSVVQLPSPAFQLPDATEVSLWVARSVDVAAEIGRLHEAGQVDIVEVPDWASEGYVHLLSRQAWRRIPTLLQTHGSVGMLRDGFGWPEPGSALERIGSHMEETCIRLADVVAASSRTSREWLVSAFGLDEASVPILHAGVDTDRFQPAPDQAREAGERPVTVVFVGRVSPTKGAETLVAAAREVVKDGRALRLRLLGRVDSAYRQQLESLAREDGSDGPPSWLEFAGHRGRDELASEMRLADVFALPTLFEAGPCQAFMEAMSCGLASIGPSSGAIAEYATDGRDALLVPPADRNALAAKLAALVRYPRLRAELGAAARRTAVTALSSSVWVPRIAAVYQGLIDGVERAHPSLTGRTR